MVIFFKGFEFFVGYLDQGLFQGVEFRFFFLVLFEGLVKFGVGRDQRCVFGVYWVGVGFRGGRQFIIFCFS